MKSTTSALVIFFATHLSFDAAANELVTFSAGQPAKAAEVNANFKLLQDKLNELGSFQNLSEQQLEALRGALGTAAIKRGVADCRTNPNALNQVLSYGANDLATIAIVTVQGSCYPPALPTNVYDFNLVLAGDPGTGAALIPSPNATWNLLGGFNGGLFLSDLAVNPPQDRTGVLFSRVSQGDIRNVTINGGAVGISVGVNAQVYLQNVEVKDTLQTGIAVVSGGDLRFQGNTDPTKQLIKTTTGTGLYVEAATVLLADTTIEAPQAVTVILNGTAYSLLQGSLRFIGNMYMRDAGAFSANNLDVTGRINVEQSSFNAVNLNLKGSLRVADGAVAKVGRGKLEAQQPGADDFQLSSVIDVYAGSVVRLGSYREDGTVNTTEIMGRTQSNSSNVTISGVSFDGGFFAESSVIRADFSDFKNSFRPNDAVINLNHGTNGRFFNSNVSGDHLYVGMNSHFDCSNTMLNGTRFDLSRADFHGYQCSGNGLLNVNASKFFIGDSDFSQSVLIAGVNTSIEMTHSQIGLLHLETATTATLFQSSIVGVGATPWGDGAIRVGANVILAMDGSTVENPRDFQIDGGILRLQNTTNIAGSSLFCSPRGYVQYRTEDRQALNIGNNNCSE